MANSPTPILDRYKAMPPALGELRLTLLEFGACAFHDAMGTMSYGHVREAMAHQARAAISASICLSPDLVRDAVMSMRTVNCPTIFEEVEAALALAAEFDERYLFPEPKAQINLPRSPYE